MTITWRRLLPVLLAGVGTATAVFAPPTRAEPAASPPTHWKYAAKPPMGWNSYDSFGDSVTEAEVLANAEYMQDHLLSHGWNYVVVDFRWYDPGAHSGDPNDRAGVALTADAFGRLQPATNRFPSAVAGEGFRPLADKIHAMGLRFGIHVMRGIPRQAVNANTPIKDSRFHAADAAITNSTCSWCPDMYGVDAGKAAGQAWYDSIIHQYAAWGVDYIKVDDLSRPYSALEVEAIRKAIVTSGRPIVLSLSPGETPVVQAEHVKTHANLWRVADDLWDNWNHLDHMFEFVARWQGHGGPGHWPDADMIPLGRIAKRSMGKERWTRFTKDEQITLMTLWAITPSPLMLGMNLPENDEWTLSVLTNDEVLAVNQDRLGKPGLRVVQQDGIEVWVKKLEKNAKAIALFNRGPQDTEATLKWNDVGLAGKQSARDLWFQRDLGVFERQISLLVPKHGAVFLINNARK